MATAAPASHNAVRWDPRPRPDLEDVLLQSFKHEDLGDLDLVSWTCPVCEAPNSRTLKRDSQWVGGLTAETVGEPRTGELLLRCTCSLEHQGRPTGAVGCGYEIMLEIEEGPEE